MVSGLPVIWGSALYTAGKSLSARLLVRLSALNEIVRKSQRGGWKLQKWKLLKDNDSGTPSGFYFAARPHSTRPLELTFRLSAMHLLHSPPVFERNHPIENTFSWRTSTSFVQHKRFVPRAPLTVDDLPIYKKATQKNVNQRRVDGNLVEGEEKHGTHRATKHKKQHKMFASTPFYSRLICDKWAASGDLEN